MNSQRPNALLAAAIAAVITVALTGCAPGAVPAGLSVELVQLRSDVASRGAQVRVVNESATPLEVRGVELRDARFAAPVMRAADTRIPPGRTLDLRVDLPLTVCPVVEGLGEPTLELELAGIGVVELPASDPTGFLVRLHTQDCLGEEVRRRAEIDVVGLGLPLSPDGLATLRIRLESSGVPGLELVELLPTNLLRYDADRSVPHPLHIVVDASGLALELEIPLVPQRCDPHAIMEDKRGTVFPLVVDVGGASGVIDLVTPPAMAAEIFDWVGRWCRATS